MINERLEELAALHALGLLDPAGERELLEAARRDAEVRGMVQEFAETAALLALEAPQKAPPPQVKSALLGELPAPGPALRTVHVSRWIPYALAACLMVLAVGEMAQIAGLNLQLRSLQGELAASDSEVLRLRQSNAMKDLRLAVLQAAPPAQADAAFASSHIVVAWDPARHQGIVSMENLPVPPPGHDYQLWVLDPKAAKPISAGVITGSRPFATGAVSTAKPGFAISLEPAGGRPAPTGPILFAAGPGS